jgi:hypothetical protein
MKSKKKLVFLQTALGSVVAARVSESFARLREPVLSLAKKEKPALLESLKRDRRL